MSLYFFVFTFKSLKIISVNKCLYNRESYYKYYNTDLRTHLPDLSNTLIFPLLLHIGEKGPSKFTSLSLPSLPLNLGRDLGFRWLGPKWWQGWGAPLQQVTSCPGVQRHLDQLQHLQTMNYHLALKNKEVLVPVKAQMNLEHIILSGKSHSQETIYHLILLTEKSGICKLRQIDSKGAEQQLTYKVSV